MSEVQIILIIVNGATVLLSCVAALVCPFASAFAKGDYRIGHNLAPETLSFTSLPEVAWQVLQGVLIVAAFVAVFVIPSTMLASRGYRALAVAFAVTPYVPLVWFFWVISSPPVRHH